MTNVYHKVADLMQRKATMRQIEALGRAGGKTMLMNQWVMEHLKRSIHQIGVRDMQLALTQSTFMSVLEKPMLGIPPMEHRADGFITHEGMMAEIDFKTRTEPVRVVKGLGGPINYRGAWLPTQS